MTEYKLNRLETTKLIRPMVDEYWESLRTAKERGKLVAWCAGPLFMLTGAMGVPTHFMAGYASYCAGVKGVDPLFEAAEADGHLPECCSYHRLHMGMLALVRKGLPIREDIRLPVPDLIIDSKLCPEMSHYCESIYRQFKTTIIPVDLPIFHDEADHKDAIPYVERQLKEVAIPAIEKILGRPYDYDRLIEIFDVLKKTAMLRNECLELTRSIPAPWTLFDFAVSLAPVMYLMGKPGTIEYYQKLKEELQQRVSQKVSAILPEEKYRVYWDHFIMWNWLGPLSRKLTSYGANLIVGRYPYMMWPHPESIEPERPLYTIAEQMMNWMGPRGTPAGGEKFLADSIERYSLDGLIFLSSRTCRVFSGGQQDVLDEMDRRYGIPGVIIEADQIDPKFYSEAQIDTRLQALFEMIDGRRKARAA